MFTFFIPHDRFALQRKCGVSDSVRDPRHHPRYGDQCAVGTTSTDRRDREADQGAESVDRHDDPHGQQARRRDHHLHHLQLRDPDFQVSHDDGTFKLVK